MNGWMIAALVELALLVIVLFLIWLDRNQIDPYDNESDI